MNRKIALFFIVVLMCSCARNQNLDQDAATEQVEFKKEAEVNWPQQFGFGVEASAERIAANDIDVKPDGEGLPEGSGTVVAGKSIYLKKCVACHGTKTSDGSYDRLFANDKPLVQGDSMRKGRPTKTIGNYWPYATTLYDYINRAMPFNQPGSLEPHEVYSLTAYLLFENGLIDENLVLTSASLPRVVMPAQQRFVNDDRQGGAEVK